MITKFTIFEDYRQEELPFDNSGKPIHVQFLDAIDKLSTKNVSTYVSNKDISKCIDEGLSNFKDDNGDSKRVYHEFYNSALNGDMGDLPIDVKKELDKYEHDDDFAEHFDYEHDKTPLRDFFLEKLETVLRYLCEDMIYTVEDCDENGLIYCERELYLQLPEGDNMDSNALYKIITEGHKGIGIYWSWKEGGAEAQWAESRRQLSVLLKGRCRPEDVNWTRTVHVNAYDLWEEREIELLEGAFVKIDTAELQYVGRDEKSVVLQIDKIVPTGMSWR